MISGPGHNGCQNKCIDRRTVTRPNRDACDRCHSTKTRCVRTEHSEICVRCERLGCSCHYSPVGRTGRPLGSQKKSKKGIICQERDVRRHDRVSPIGEANQTTASESGQSSLFTDMDFYSLLSGANNDSFSTFLMNDLVPEVPVAAPMYACTESSADLSSSPLHMDQSSQDIAHATQKFSHTPSVGFASVDALRNLVDIQVHLVNLIQSLSTNPVIPENIEDVYRITETLTGMLNEVGGGGTCRQQNSSLSNGAAVFLFSSCYYSLIVACGHFVRILQLDLQGSENSSDYDSCSPMCYGGPLSDPPRGSIAISVGEFRLALTRKILAEINLHLIKRTLEHLRISIQRHGYTNYDPIQGENLQGTEDKENLPHASSANMNPLASLVGASLRDLQQKEDDLFEALNNITGVSRH